MPFCSLLNYVKPRRRSRLARMSRREMAVRRSSACRPRFERLEERLPFSGTYTQTNLAADQPGVALVHDPELIEAWGISINPNGTFWLSARATDVSTVYSGDVTRPDGTFIPFVKSPLTVTVPGGGTDRAGIQRQRTDFVVSSGAANAPARFIFAGDGGHITGWSAARPAPPPPPPSRNAQLMATTPNAVYTGLAIGNNGTGNFLYAADFRNGEIDVFDRTYTPTTLAGDFVDPAIPDGYSPFNIWDLGGKLYVTYAKQDNGDALPDGGTGFVSVFDTNGNFLQSRRLPGPTQRTLGPGASARQFRRVQWRPLVGNFGDGTISAYNPASGTFLGQLADATGGVLKIDGLLGLHFGNGTVSGDRNALYFAAAPDGGAHGLFGSLRVGPVRVESVVVNDGAAQRSMVNSLTVTFDGPVTIDSGAFELLRQDGILVTPNVTTSEVNGQTIAVLTFVGSGIIGGSLADGNYELTIQSDHIRDAVGRELDGDGDGTASGDGRDAFFRLFGDSDGDRDVDGHDLFRFISTFGRQQGQSRYLDYMDFNGDDRVGLVDLIAFGRRVGTRLQR